MAPLSLDQAFQEVGTFGRYQILYFFFYSFCGFAVTFQMLHMIFIGAKPEFECISYGSSVNSVRDTESKVFSIMQTSQNTSSVEDHCTMEGKECSAYHYTSNFTSIITEWDLVCGRAYQASLGQSLFMAGVLSGAAFFGPVADIFGRKRTYFVTLLGGMISSTISAFSNSIYIFLAFRFLAGFHSAGTILASFVLLMEIVGSEWRAFVSFVSPMFGSVALALMALLAYVVPNWRELSLIFASAGYVFLPFFFLIPESPRWLYGRGRIGEAERMFLRFARKNGAKITSIELEPNVISHKAQSSSVLCLVKNFTTLRVTLIQFYTWLVNCIVYYGTTMGAGDLGGNMYVSVILSGLVEIPANIFVLVILKYVGRRTTCCVVMVLGGIACLGIMFVPLDHLYAVNALALAGKISVSVSFTIIYLWSSEIFPTVMRNGCMGLMSVGARTGGIISPFMNLLSESHPVLPYIVFGGLSISSGILNIFLPETKDKVLPQTIEDMLRLCGKQIDHDIFDNSVNLDEQRIQLLENEIMIQDSSDEEITEYERAATTQL